MCRHCADGLRASLGRAVVFFLPAIVVWLRGTTAGNDPRQLGLVAGATASLRAKVVVTDIDGTLMDSSHQLPAANRRTLQRCLRQKVPVVLATGKHRGPWVKDLIANVVEDDLQAASASTLNAPGVFVQGLLVCDAAGKVVHRQLLPQRVVEMCCSVAEANKWTLLAYTDEDKIISSRSDALLEILSPLKEPVPEIAPLTGINGVYKMIFVATPEQESVLRAQISSRVGADASITVAIAGLVEVLPRGSSKADGVQVALGLLGLEPRDAIALGDGENDIELLELVRAAGGRTVAVSNARPKLKAVAESVVASCDEGGWSEAVERWVLLQ